NKPSNGNYQEDIEYTVAKYRTDEKGKRPYDDVKGQTSKEETSKKPMNSLQLNDYIDIGVFGKKKKHGKNDIDHQIYLVKHKIDKIHNTVSVVVSEEPSSCTAAPIGVCTAASIRVVTSWCSMTY